MSVEEKEALVEIVVELLNQQKSAEDIVNTIIECLTPEDDEECPVCGIAP